MAGHGSRAKNFLSGVLCSGAGLVAIIPAFTLLCLVDSAIRGTVRLPAPIQFYLLLSSYTLTWFPLMLLLHLISMVPSVRGYCVILATSVFAAMLRESYNIYGSLDVVSVLTRHYMLAVGHTIVLSAATLVAAWLFRRDQAN